MRKAPYVLLLLGFLVGQGNARTWHVPSETATVRAAADSASSGDIIEIVSGVYYEHDIQLANGVTVTSATGNPGDVSLDAQRQGRLFQGNGIRIVGISMQNGLPQDDGGAIKGSGTIVHCVFQNNKTNTSHTLYAGGAVYGFFTINNTEFHNNSAMGYGGAVAIANAVNECVFIGNHSTYEWGGAAYNCRSFSDCHFQGNGACSGGHAIYFKESSGTIERCTFTQNTAYTGVIRGFGASPVIRYCTFYNNGSSANHVTIDMTAEIGAGIPTPRIENCTLYGEGTAIAAHGNQEGLEMAVNNTIIANCLRLSEASSGGHVTFNCCNFWQNGSLQSATRMPSIKSELDPLFCSAEMADFRLDSVSPCLPDNSGGCGLIGAWGVGCGVVDVEKKSLGSVKQLFR